MLRVLTKSDAPGWGYVLDPPLRTHLWAPQWCTCPHRLKYLWSQAGEGREGKSCPAGKVPWPQASAINIRKGHVCESGSALKQLLISRVQWRHCLCVYKEKLLELCLLGISIIAQRSVSMRGTKQRSRMHENCGRLRGMRLQGDSTSPGTGGRIRDCGPGPLAHMGRGTGNCR